MVAVLDVQPDSPYLCDVSDAAQVAAAAERIETELGPVGVLVNNAGIAHIAPSETLPEVDWRRSLESWQPGRSSVLATSAAGC